MGKSCHFCEQKHEKYELFLKRKTRFRVVVIDVSLRDSRPTAGANVIILVVCRRRCSEKPLFRGRFRDIIIGSRWWCSLVDFFFILCRARKFFVSSFEMSLDDVLDAGGEKRRRRRGDAARVFFFFFFFFFSSSSSVEEQEKRWHRHQQQ